MTVGRRGEGGGEGYLARVKGVEVSRERRAMGWVGRMEAWWVGRGRGEMYTYTVVHRMLMGGGMGGKGAVRRWKYKW